MEKTKPVSLTTPKKTSKQLFEAAFPADRCLRSPEYREGVRLQLAYRMLEIDFVPFDKYKEGTCQFDAFWAGVDEAWSILLRSDCDYRKQANHALKP